MCSQRGVVSPEQPVGSQQPLGWVEKEETQPRALNRRRKHRGIGSRWRRWRRRKCAEQPTSRRTVPGMRRPIVRLPLQRSHVRGMQGVLPEEYYQERCVPMQVRKQLRNRHVHEAEVPGVPAEKMPDRWHEA